MRVVLLVAAVAALLSFTLEPARANFEPAPTPVAPGEQAARACYVRAMDFWNSIMAAHPSERGLVDNSYKGFAKCADVSIKTGKFMRDGKRRPWFADYFASTIGATYAQVQLATITTGSERCSHLGLAHDLAVEAMMTEGGFTPATAGFAMNWSGVIDRLKRNSLSCGAKIFQT
ncbi:MAG: hypothetical protein ACXVAW_04005 [Vulcanimicrobiaceae bacterium]